MLITLKKPKPKRNYNCVINGIEIKLNLINFSLMRMFRSGVINWHFKTIPWKKRTNIESRDSLL